MAYLFKNLFFIYISFVKFEIFIYAKGGKIAIKS